ncbi:MAG TPA: MarR family winged helix-turn-helix transcriptional regulator [Acidimicrobiales bacterium]
MSRKAFVDALYDELSLLVRRSQEFSGEIHAGLSLVDYTLLTRIAGNPGTRAADLAALFGLDKSTLSRQINPLVERGLVERAGERPGKRGVVLELTGAGDDAVLAATDGVRAALGRWLRGWTDREVRDFAAMVARLNERVKTDPLLGG